MIPLQKASADSNRVLLYRETLRQPPWGFTAIIVYQEYAALLQERIQTRRWRKGKTA